MHPPSPLEKAPPCEAPIAAIIAGSPSSRRDTASYPGAERLEDRQLLAVTGVTEYSIPTPGGEPTVIVTGPDGNLWFNAGNSIGEINPTSHAVSEFLIPTPNAGSRGIVSGPDGNLWFTEESTGKVGSINPSTHVIAEYALPVPSSGPSAITAGSDGNLWFNEAYSFGGTLGFINPTTKAITEVQVSGGSYLNSVTSGSDGNIWATGAANNDTVGNLIRVVPSTQAVTVYHTAARSTDPTEITSGRRRQPLVHRRPGQRGGLRQGDHRRDHRI